MSTKRIQKDDLVVVIAGDNAGKTGKVIKIDYKSQRALVEGVNLVKKNVRKCDQFPEGKQLDMPAPIHLSNLQLWNEKAKKGCRVSYVREGDHAVRVAKKTGTRFEKTEATK